MRRTLQMLFLFMVATLSAADLKFQGFAADYAKFGGMGGGYREFEIRVEHAPYHFIAKGKVSAGPQTSDLDILTDEIGIAVSYFDEGTPQVTAYNEVMFFVQDEPTKVKDVTFELLSPANSKQGLASLANVPALVTAYKAGTPAAKRLSSEESLVTAALADPWSKAQKDDEIKVKAATVQKARQDSVNAAAAKQAKMASAEKARQDSITAAKQARIAAPRQKTSDLTAAPAPAPVAAPAPVQQQESTPVRKSGKISNMTANEEQADASEVKEPNTNGAPSDKTGFMGNKGNRTKVGIGLAVVGSILIVYGMLQQSTVADRKAKMDVVAGVQNGVFTQEPNSNTPLNQFGFSNISQSYNDLQNEKQGAETARNLALVLGALSIGGSVVMFRF